MNTLEEIKEQDHRYLMQTYGRFDVALVAGHGATAVDCDGKEYIDFTSGIGVNSLGYSDPIWARAVAEQAATLQHTSNLYYSPVQGKLAQRLCNLPAFPESFSGIPARRPTNAPLSWRANTAPKPRAQRVTRF